MSACPPRERLPDRRLQQTETLVWNGREWVMSVGFTPDGRVLEVFTKGLKAGSTLDAIADDVCVLLSLLLQSGYSAAALARHLGREATDTTAPAASPIGLLAEMAAMVERQHGSAVRAIHGLPEVGHAL